MKIWAKTNVEIMGKKNSDKNDPKEVKSKRIPGTFVSKSIPVLGVLLVGAPKLPKCRTPVLKRYRTYRSVGHRFTELTEVLGGGIKVVPYRTNTATPGFVLEGIPIPGGIFGWAYRTYRSVGCRIEREPSLPKCRVPC